MPENANTSSWVIYVAPIGPSEISKTVPKTGAGNSALEKTERFRDLTAHIVAQWGSVFGNLADLDEGEILLPSFIKQKEDGFYADLETVNRDPSVFQKFADETFWNGAYLFKLDYPQFSKLAFDTGAVTKLLAEFKENGLVPEIRFATGVIRMPEDRRSLYRTVKVSPRLSDASYLFEPLYVDRIEKTELPDGSVEEKTVSERAYLDFDEFVAYLWTKGVKYGLLEDEIRANVSAETPKAGWQTVARQLEAVPGADATTKKATDRFEKNRAPVVNEHGRMILTHFQNSFPQVSADERLLEKIPRKMGANGRTVDGRLIEPPLPKDIDLSALAGPGTRIETVEGRTFLVAAINGYINEDPKTGIISVSEKIVHREGVNMRHTGDIDLEGEHFEEHGEVGENRVVRGRSFHFKGDLHGIVHSESGTVLAEARVAGAKIYAKGHKVDLVGGLVSNTLVEAPNAEVAMKYAENSVIIGKKVTVERAVNCVIVSEDAEIGEAIASSVGTKRVRIRAAQEKNGNPTSIVLEVPDLRELRAPLEETLKTIWENQTKLDALRKRRMQFSQAAEAIKKDPGTAAFVRLKKTIIEAQSQKKSVSREVAEEFARVRSHGEVQLKKYSQITEELKKIDSDISEREIILAPLLELKVQQEEEIVRDTSGISVAVEKIMGEISVRKRTVSASAAKTISTVEEEAKRKKRPLNEEEKAHLETLKKRRPLSQIPSDSERKSELSVSVEPADRLFSGSGGTLSIDYSESLSLALKNHF